METGAEGTWCGRENHCWCTEPNRPKPAPREWPDRVDLPSLWGQTGPSGFPAVLSSLRAAFQERWDVLGEHPPSPPRKAALPRRGSGLWPPWSTALPLPSLRFPINRLSRSVLWHQIHSRWRGSEVVPSEATVNDSGFTVGSCYGKFTVHRSCGPQESQAGAEPVWQQRGQQGCHPLLKVRRCEGGGAHDAEKPTCPPRS